MDCSIAMILHMRSADSLAIRNIGHQFHITNDEAMTWDMIMNTYG